MNFEIEVSGIDKDLFYINIKFENGETVKNVRSDNPTTEHMKKLLKLRNVKKYSRMKKSELFPIFREHFGNLIDRFLSKDEIITNKVIPKGSNCSKSGNAYEKVIFDIVNKCKNESGNPFNLQKLEELGGSSSTNDIVCLWNDIKIPIEIKKCKTPDWMQCSLKYDELNKCWTVGDKNKIPRNSALIFNSFLKEFSGKIFDGKVPGFFKEKISHSKWETLKDDYKDFYIDCPNDTINKLYLEKDCKYIQISDKGLYSLERDICNFDVPRFECEQQLRVRVKVHSRGSTGEVATLSVTISCKPKNILKMTPSPFSLDSIEKLPKNLKYDN